MVGHYKPVVLPAMESAAGPGSTLARMANVAPVFNRMIDVDDMKAGIMDDTLDSGGAGAGTII